MDVHSKYTRSYNMSKVKSRATKPEETVRKFLFSKGLRYRKNVKKLPGCPDIVLGRFRCVIFVNGCFWHVHENCKKFSWPKSNKDFWKAKLKSNQERDIKNIQSLKNENWRVIVVWECELKKATKEEKLCQLFNEITGW